MGVSVVRRHAFTTVLNVSMNFSALWVKHSLWEIFLNSFTFGEICVSRTGIFWSNKFPMNFWIYFIWTILRFYIKADILLLFTRRNCILIYFCSESRPSNNLLKSYARIGRFSIDTNALFYVKGNKMRALKFSWKLIHVDDAFVNSRQKGKQKFSKAWIHFPLWDSTSLYSNSSIIRDSIFWSLFSGRGMVDGSIS